MEGELSKWMVERRKYDETWMTHINKVQRIWWKHKTNESWYIGSNYEEMEQELNGVFSIDLINSHCQPKHWLIVKEEKKIMWGTKKITTKFCSIRWSQPDGSFNALCFIKDHISVKPFKIRSFCLVEFSKGEAQKQNLQKATNLSPFKAFITPSTWN